MVVMYLKRCISNILLLFILCLVISITGCSFLQGTEEPVSEESTVSSNIISDVCTSEQIEDVEEEWHITDPDIVFQRPAYKTEDDAEKILKGIIEDDTRYKGKYSQYYHMIGKKWKVYSCIDQLFETLDFIVLPVSDTYPQTGYEFIVSIEMGQYPMLESCKQFIAYEMPKHENTLFNELSMSCEFDSARDFFESCSMYKPFEIDIKLPENISYIMDEDKTKEIDNIKTAVEERLKQENIFGKVTYYVRDYNLSEYCRFNVYFELDGFIESEDGKLYKFTYLSDYYQRPIDEPRTCISAFEAISDDDAANIYYFDRIKAFSQIKNSLTVTVD